MRSLDLRAEYLSALRAMTSADLAPLFDAGIAPAIAVGVIPALAQIRLCKGNLFEPDPESNEAWIFPVRVTEPPVGIETADPLAVVRSGSIIDLVAFHPRAQRRWALRAGVATVLGAIGPQYLDPPPEPVHRDVTAWLRSGCRGVVLLSHDPVEAQRLLREIRYIEAEDEAHRAELSAIARTPWPTAPEITVSGQRQGLAI